MRTKVRRLGERMLHPLRRRRALERIAAPRSIRSVLFVCHGNIYRSPFAAACFSSLVRADGVFRVGSAGFLALNRPVPPDAQAAARARGLDLSAHRSLQLDKPLVSDWNLIVVMEARQARELERYFDVPPERLLVLGDLDPLPIERRSIADPWFSPETLLAASYERVARCVAVLANLALTDWPAAQPVDSAAGPKAG